MKSSQIVLKITIKWSLTKSHATGLKSTKFNTYVIKPDQSYCLSYDLSLFLSYKKLPKVTLVAVIQSSVFSID